MSEFLPEYKQTGVNLLHFTNISSHNLNISMTKNTGKMLVKNILLHNIASLYSHKTK